MEMNFEITETLCFDIDYLAYRIACMDERFMEALEAGELVDDYFRLDDNQRKALRIAVFERCAPALKKEED